MKPLHSVNGRVCPHPLDAHRNRVHARALATVSAFMGKHPWSTAEFLYGQLVSGWTVPF